MSPPVSANAMGAETHGWTASGRPDIARLIRAARRHRRVVRVVRIALPIGIVAALAAVFLVSYLDPMRMLDKLPAVAGKLAVSGSKITMEAPRIAGITRDSRAYELTAETAVQDITKPDMIDLQNIRASMEFPDQNVVQIAAANGIYDSKADKILLRDRVTFTSAQGYRGRLREAAVDVKKGSVVSEQPVEVALPDALIKANRLEITESGDLIRFDGGVVVTIHGDTSLIEAPAR